MDNKTLNVLFSLDPLSTEQTEALATIRAQTRALSELYNRIIPEVGEKQIAIQNLYQAMTSAEQAIRFHGVSRTTNMILMQ